MNTIIWNIFRLGFIEVFLIYAIAFVVFLTFLVRSVRKRKRTDFVFLSVSILLSLAFQAIFTFSFRYTEKDSKHFIEMVIERNELSDRIDWNGDEIDFPIKEGTVEVVDEFLGSWDLRIHSESATLYDLSITKKDGNWIVHSMKKKKSEQAGRHNSGPRSALTSVSQLKQSAKNA